MGFDAGANTTLFSDWVNGKLQPKVSLSLQAALSKWVRLAVYEAITEVYA